MDWQSDFKEGERLLAEKDLDKAEASFRRAYRALKRTRTRSEDDMANLTGKLAEVIYRQDQITESIPLYKKALRITEKCHGKQSPEAAPRLMALGKVFEDEGDYKKASRYYQDALAIAAANHGGNNSRFAEVEDCIGRMQAKQGLFREAEESYFSALTTAMKLDTLPGNDCLSGLLSDYINLLLRTEYGGKILNSVLEEEVLKDRIGDLPQKQAAPASQWSAQVSMQIKDAGGPDRPSRTAAASPAKEPVAGEIKNGRISEPEAALDGNNLHQQALPERGQGLGAKVNPDFAPEASDLAALQEINQQRVTFYERMIAADIDSLGADHPSVARDLSALASIYIAQKKFVEARPLLMRALEIYRKIYKDDTAPVKQTELLINLIADESVPPLPIDLSMLDALPKIPLQAQRVHVALRLNDLAFMLYCHNRIERAAQVYYWGLAGTARSTGQTSQLTAANMLDLSRVLRSAGRFAEAERFETCAQAIARRNLLEQRARLLPL